MGLKAKPMRNQPKARPEMTSEMAPSKRISAWMALVAAVNKYNSESSVRGDEAHGGAQARNVREDTWEDPVGHGGAHRLVAQVPPHGQVQALAAHEPLQTAYLPRTPG